jgi:putative transposase
VAILQQQANGQTVAQIVREHGLSEATFYAWKSKYAGASVGELTRLKHLEEENRRLNQMFADLSLENQAIKEILRISLSLSSWPNTRRCGPSCQLVCTMCRCNR